MDVEMDVEMMNTFKTNDGVNIKYIDTVGTDPEASEKDTLILVRWPFVLSISLNCVAILSSFRLLRNSY